VVVHLASRHAMGAELALRPAAPEDMPAIGELLGSGQAAAEMTAQLLKAQGGLPGTCQCTVLVVRLLCGALLA
jgi:hypothetical protein